MANPIVIVNVEQQVGVTPNQLQRTGAIVTQGGTNTPAGTRTLLTELADLAPILNGAKAITTITWSGSVATAALPANLDDVVPGDVLPLTIAGVLPAGYNGVNLQCTVVDATHFTYPLVSNPGSQTQAGTYTDVDVADLLSAATSFFAQGNANGVYVLELGEDQPADGPPALKTYIDANPNFFYAFQLPRNWTGQASLLTLLGQFQSLTAKVKFYINAVAANYAQFTNAMREAFIYVEPPGLPALENQAAMAFYDLLALNPSSTSKVPPMSFTYQFGATPYPQNSNAALLTAIIAAAANYAGTGAEGQLSNVILRNGTFKDGNDVTYQYSTDWIQINSDLVLSAAIIQGSNSTQNPLYLNQDGINRLQAVETNLIDQGVSYGLVLNNSTQTELSPADLQAALASGQLDGLTVVNAVPFNTYYAANPSDFPLGKYGGLSVSKYTPNRGFITIVFNLQIQNFAS